MLTLTLPHFIMDLLSDRGTDKGNSVEVPATNLNEVRAFFADRHPQACVKIFDESGLVRKNVILVINDELVARTQHLEVRFKDGDQAALMVQFAGG